VQSSKEMVACSSKTVVSQVVAQAGSALVAFSVRAAYAHVLVLVVETLVSHQELSLPSF
jgi:hypothetical protein